MYNIKYKIQNEKQKWRRATVDRKHGCVLRWLMDRPHLVQTLHCKASDYDRVLWKYKVRNRKKRNVKMKKNSATKIHKGLQSLLPRESCFWIQNTKYRSLSAVHLKLWWSKMFFSLLRFIRGLMPPKRVAIQWKPERTKHLPMDIRSLTSKNILHGIISVLHI